MFLNNSSNKRRSIFFGNNHSNAERVNKTAPNPNNTKSNFKTFSVIHVSNPEEHLDSQDHLKNNENRILSDQHVTKNGPHSLVRRSSSSYKSDHSIKPNLSVMSRPPPPNVDINSIYYSINSNIGGPKKNLLLDETSGSLNAGNPVEGDSNYNLFAQQASPQEDVVSNNDWAFEDEDTVSYTKSEDYVQQKEGVLEEEAFDCGSSLPEDQGQEEIDAEDTFDYVTSLKNGQDEEESSNDGDFIISHNYKMNSEIQQQPLLGDFKKHNRERSQLEEYLDELEDFNLSDNSMLKHGDTKIENSPENDTQVHDTTFDYIDTPAKYQTHKFNESTSSSDVSNLFANKPGGLVVVNVESDEKSDFSSSSDGMSGVSVGETDSSDSHFDEHHSQLSAVKSLYHSEDDGLLLDQASLPSLPYTISNNLNTLNTERTPTSVKEFMESLSPNHSIENDKMVSANEFDSSYLPKSLYVTKLLHKYPTSNKTHFNLSLPLNLKSNPVEDINAKTTVVKQQRKSKNIKHKTPKKKLLSNEEPTVIELMQSNRSGLKVHNRDNSAHNPFLGDIDEEERLILQSLPGSEGYQKNSLLKNNFETKGDLLKKNRNRSDTTKSYYTRNVNRLRTETIDTIDTMNRVNLDGLQVTNPDDI